MVLRIGVTLSGLALAGAVNGCTAEDPAEAIQATEAQVEERVADRSSEHSTDSSTGTPTLRGSWRVRALVGPQGESVLVGPYAHGLKMTFREGALSGSAGCNSVFGTYRLAGENLTFPARKLGSTLVGCDEPPLVRRLADVRHVSGSGNVRYLHAEDWMIVAELRRR